jgi:hypothetical protein
LFDLFLAVEREGSEGPVALHLVSGEGDDGSATSTVNEFAANLETKIEVGFAVVDGVAIHELDFDAGFAADAL